MEEPRKPASRWGGPGSPLKTLVLGVLLLAGLSAAIFVGAPAPPPPEVPPAFLEFSRTDATTVDVKVGQVAIHLERDAKNRDRWRLLKGSALVRASSEKVDDLLNDLSRLSPKNLWKADEVKPEERKAWGLAEPAAEVRVGLEGREVRAVFGKRTAEGNNAYAERDGNGDVWVVPGTVLQTLEGLNPEGLRERKPVGHLSTWDVKSLVLERADGVRLEAEKGTTGTWEVTRPYRGAAHPTDLDGLLTKVLQVEVKEFAADENPDPDRYGLRKPRATIALRKQGAETPVEVLLGGEAPGGGAYFCEKGDPSIYVCGPEMPGAVLGLDPAAIRDRNALRIGWARPDSIEYRGGEGKGWKLLRVLERWDVEKPVRSAAEGPAVDGLLDLLRNAEVETFLDAEEPAALGLDDPEKAPARLTLAGTDDAARDVLLGARDASGNAPARLLDPKDAKARGTLFVLRKDLLDRLEEGWLSFRGLEVWKLDLSEVRGLARTMGGKTETFDFEKSVWRAAGGGPAPDGEALTRALSHLLTLRCTEYVAEAKGDLGKWGLGDPPATASISIRLRKAGKDAKEEVRTLLLGTDAEGGGCWARLSDGDAIFRLPGHVQSGIETKPFLGLLAAPFTKAAAETPPPAPPPAESPPKEPEKTEPPKEPERPEGEDGPK